ncbi:copper ABC transporter ATP-binding protein [Zobellella endophytica]|uniref:Copper ABC transporter ATP-binding protein n=1 Tax=Zobellella endophytica TaxID=2116700 RepID=A0A2P7R279_9GAMM|nr:ABC transporter ATP-binding protein [Zobellella endophytica]PSJ44310.1 copper ABC transporter ATP-binding protein [Zobellella endophytica]
MSIIRLRQVSKQFADKKALRQVSLAVSSGEVLGLLGHNGAGKTTSIKLILGLLRPDEGEVRVMGQDPARDTFRKQRRHIGFLQENVSFYDQLTGAEVIGYLARLKGMAPKQGMTLLERLGLAEAAGRRVKTYSKGMRQRLGLAQAMLGQPRVLLLDEPTVGLDPLATRDFYQQIDELRRQGCAIILCSHVLAGVEPYLDRIAVMGQGRLLASGNLAELRAKSRLPVTLTLYGDNLEQQLPESCQALVCQSEPGQLALQGQPEQKKLLAQAICSLPGLRDFHWQQPNLPELYQHICYGAADGRITDYCP